MDRVSAAAAPDGGGAPVASADVAPPRAADLALIAALQGGLELVPRPYAVIAERLGLDRRTVTEIRCVAEREYYDIDEWQQAIEFKERACRGYARQGLSFVTKKYVKR